MPPTRSGPLRSTTMWRLASAPVSVPWARRDSERTSNATYTAPRSVPVTTYTMSRASRDGRGASADMARLSVVRQRARASPERCSSALTKRPRLGTARDDRPIHTDEFVHRSIEVELLRADPIGVPGDIELGRVLDERVDPGAESPGVAGGEAPVLIEREARGGALGGVRDERRDAGSHRLEDRHPLELHLARVNEEVGLREA